MHYGMFWPVNLLTTMIVASFSSVLFVFCVTSCSKAKAQPKPNEKKPASAMKSVQQGPVKTHKSKSLVHVTPVHTSAQGGVASQASNVKPSTLSKQSSTNQVEPHIAADGTTSLVNPTKVNPSAVNQPGAAGPKAANKLEKKKVSPVKKNNAILAPKQKVSMFGQRKPTPDVTEDLPQSQNRKDTESDLNENEPEKNEHEKHNNPRHRKNRESQHKPPKEGHRKSRENKHSRERTTPSREGRKQFQQQADAKTIKDPSIDNDLKFEKDQTLDQTKSGMKVPTMEDYVDEGGKMEDGEKTKEIHRQADALQPKHEATGAKGKLIAEKNAKRKNTDYPTMEDVVSDWSSEDVGPGGKSKERKTNRQKKGDAKTNRGKKSHDVKTARTKKTNELKEKKKSVEKVMNPQFEQKLEIEVDKETKTEKKDSKEEDTDLNDLKANQTSKLHQSDYDSSKK